MHWADMFEAFNSQVHLDDSSNQILGMVGIWNSWSKIEKQIGGIVGSLHFQKYEMYFLR